MASWGVLPGRAPVIGRLGYGELRTKLQGTTKRYFVDGGFAQIRDNVVTVLTNRAIHAALLDLQAATQELEKAKTLRGTSEHDRDAKTKAVARATAMIRVAAQKADR